jgi:YegS/Rv2252/BmrU family lipid kinase
VGSAVTGVILNPHAAGGRALKTLPRVTKALSDLGVRFSLFVTSGPREAQTMALQFANDGVERVIAVGGDGTFNEVANGLLEADRLVPMGIVPAGTGCDLPRTLGLTAKSIEESVRIACLGTATRMDVGFARCDTGERRYFVNVAGLGFDATVADRAARTKLPGGKISYLAALATSLARYKNISVTVTSDTLSVQTRAVFVTVANARYFGGGFMITPMADISDAKLDLAIIGDLGIPELLRNIPSVYRGKHTNHPKFTHAQCTHVRVESSELAIVQVDGEILGRSPVEFSIRPFSFLVSV